MTRVVTIAGRSFGSPPVTDAAGCEWLLGGIEGWDNTGASVRREGSAVRPRAHGEFGVKEWRGGRLVAIKGTVLCPSRTTAAAVVQSLSSLLADGSSSDLVVTDVDLPTMTCEAYLAADPTVDWSLARTVSYAFEFWAPDPLRYADPVSVSTTFPVPRGGLEYDLYTDGAGTDLGYLEYGLASDTGRLTVTNTGTADASVTFQIDSDAIDVGFDIVQVGEDKRLRFQGPVASTSVLVLDGSTGNVLLDGVTDRGGQLTYRDWPVIPAATLVAGVLVPSVVQFAFLPLGATTTARLTAVIRPGSW